MTALKRLRRLARITLLLGLGACEGFQLETPTLGAGSTLHLSFQSSTLYPAPLPASMPTSPTECTGAGGAIIDLRAWETNGAFAENAAVTLWLEPAGTATLVALNKPCAASSSTACVSLDANGVGQACLLPGPEAGQHTVFARSGSIEVSKPITVGGRVLPAGGSIQLNVSPDSSALATPPGPRTCGTPAPPSCFPGLTRRASVAFHVSGPAGSPLPVEGTQLTVSVNAGWLAVPGGCAAAVGEALSQRVLETVQGSAVVDWCFSDLGSTATLRVQSGPVSETTQLTVPPVPTSLVLTASQGTAQAGGTVGFNAVVTGCDGKGIPGVPILFRATTGAVEFGGTTGVVETSARGIASVIGTVTPPVSVVASLAEAQDVLCTVDVGGAP